MRRYLIILLLISFALTGWGTNSCYYYCKGEKIRLTEDSTSFVRFRNSPGEGIGTIPSFHCIKSLTDGTRYVDIYCIDSNANPKTSACNVDGIYVGEKEFCYINDFGLRLIPTGFINVKLKSLNDYGLLSKAAADYGCIIFAQNPFMPLWYSLCMVSVTGQSSLGLANTLYESGKFAAVSPSFSGEKNEISYDPQVLQQWGLYNQNNVGNDISASPAWNYATGRGVKIAFVDSGVDLTHSDLADNAYPQSYDTETNSMPSQTYSNHGTHCAGIVAAVRNNAVGACGVAPDAQIISVSFNFSNSLNGEQKLANGINWAWLHGADIISCSWSSGYSEVITDAIDLAVSSGRNGLGCVVVCAAGNQGQLSGGLSFPATYGSNVIAVGNMQSDGETRQTSSHGTNMFLMAPGTDILSTIPNNMTALMTGTSMACPHVSGVAALMLERNPNLTYLEIQQIMAGAARKVGRRAYSTYDDKPYGTWNAYGGYGLVDAYQSIINTPRP